MSGERGMTLVELVLFIAIAGILAVALTQAFVQTTKQAPTGGNMTTATELAQERMEIILAQKNALGFANFTSANFDPCQAGTPPAVCTVPPAPYTVAASLDTTGWDDTGSGTKNPNYKVITVKVSGPQAATLTTVVANF